MGIWRSGKWNQIKADPGSVGRGGEDGRNSNEHQAETNTTKRPGTHPDETFKPFDGRFFQEMHAQREGGLREYGQRD